MLIFCFTSPSLLPWQCCQRWVYSPHLYTDRHARWWWGWACSIYQSWQWAGKRGRAACDSLWTGRRSTRPAVAAMPRRMSWTLRRLMPRTAGSGGQSSPEPRTGGCTPPLPCIALDCTGSGFVQCTGSVWCSRRSKKAAWAKIKKNSYDFIFANSVLTKVTCNFQLILDFKSLMVALTDRSRKV